jgi:hypothetical protein
MSTLTLDAIKAEQNKLADMISAFEAQAKTCFVMHFPETQIELRQGERYAGLITAKDGDCSYHLILLPGDADDINWENAKAWAAGQGGELPTRREQSLLFANLKDQFENRGYWSCEQHSSEPGRAWCQSLDYGTQDLNHKTNELRARAVRRVGIK